MSHSGANMFASRKLFKKHGMEVEDHINGNDIIPYDRTKFHLERIEVRHNVQTNAIDFIVPNRYRNLQFLNAGAQGTVVSADDQVTGERVAIKKMQNTFSHPMSAKRAYREFVLLTTIKHPNIITLKSAFTPQTTLETFQDVYVVMELMNHNLHEVIRKMAMEHRLISFFTYQMLCGIKHLHNSNIIHRDLKPSNIVVDDQCHLKVLDFGLARRQNMDANIRMSDYVVTRYYRAPEIILSIPYDSKADIWSIGCILAEIIKHTVLFEGIDRIDQWTKIVRILGTPSDEFLDKLGQPAARYVRTMRVYEPRPMVDIIPDQFFSKETENPRANLTAEACRDLLSHMLVIDPDQRYNVEEALNHPYVKLWYNEEEVNAPPSTNRYNDAVDIEARDLNDWKRLIFGEVMGYQQTHDIHNGIYQ